MTPALRGAHRFWPEKNCCQTTTQSLSKGGKTHVLHCTHWHPSFLVHMRGGLCVQYNWGLMDVCPILILGPSGSSEDRVLVQPAQVQIASSGWTCPLSDTQSTCVSWAGSPVGAAAVVCLTFPPAWPSAPFSPGASSYKFYHQARQVSHITLCW